MNATGISHELYHKINSLANEWALKGFLISFDGLLKDIQKKDSVGSNEIIDYLYTQMRNRVVQDE